MILIIPGFKYCNSMTGDGRIVLDDTTADEDATNGCDSTPAKRAKKQYPVDLPLDVVLGKMPQKVDSKTFLFFGHIGHSM